MHRPVQTRTWGLVLSAALLWCNALPAHSQSYQLTALARSTSIDNLNNLTDTQSLDLNFIDQAAALSLQSLSTEAHEGGGEAVALFQGRLGQLKAYASASHPYCCDDQGHTIARGYSDAAVQASFYDTIVVGGAGLALGTPVSYEITVQIDGSVSSPSFEIGGFLSAYAQTNVRLTDRVSGQQVILNWESSKQGAGVYSARLDTVVGNTVGLSATVAVGASITSSALTARGAHADFYHSFNYTLAPSVAGLNTTGLSGQNYLAPVPEPSSLALSALGMLGVLTWRSGKWLAASRLSAA